MSILPAAEFAADISFPVVIVGAGAAGLIAALAAREAGVEVLVIERDSTPRGSTSLSAGLIPAAGTRWQRAVGVEDTAEAFAADILAKAHDTPDPAMVAMASAMAGPTLEWLADQHGLDFSVIADFLYPGHSACRMHGLPKRAGAELIEALAAAAERAGVTVLCDAQVLKLAAEADGRIVGVVVQRPDGGTERIGCQALVLACNGYGGNKVLVAQHVPELAEALYFGHPGNQGEAILWGEALGAATRHLSGHQGHGSVAHPAGILISWATLTEGGFQINTEGQRFHNESLGYSEAASPVLRQPGGVAWSVFDSRIGLIAAQFEDFRQAEAAGIVLRAPDVAGLAARMRVPVDALAATMAEVDSLKVSGGTDRFGRSFAGVAALQPEFCAVRVTGALFHTQGGLSVDPRTRVLRENGEPLPNMFAAGGAACGVSGPDASGYLSGNGLLMATALGRQAGISAAALAKPAE